jgi:gamma-glutamyltranspeptidase / glutathione hydrolase
MRPVPSQVPSPSIRSGHANGSRRRRVAHGLWIGVLGLGLWLTFPEAKLRAGESGRAVASEAPDAADAAMAILRQGGSAADAAVTAALVGGVTNSSSSGLGGGCFIHVWDASAARSFIIDARETAPSAINNEAFENRPFGPSERGRAVGVPGELRGLYDLHRRFGKLPWSQVVLPAAQLAARGFTVNEHQGNMLAYFERELLLDAGLTDLWLRGGSAPAAGKRVKHTKLAATLRRIATGGPNAFYEGTIAAEIVSTASRAGSSLDINDLRQYRSKEREPLAREWGGYTVLTMPPPSAGGMMLLQTLGLYTRDELKQLGFGTAAYWHALAEAFRGAISDRMRFVGDPDFVEVNTQGLISEERMRVRRSRISMERTHAIPRFDQSEHGTHHLVTADSQGDVVSLTTTINGPFGSKLTTSRSGILLNNELDDFTEQEAVGKFGLLESPNRARASARPTSSMMPTLVVKDGRVVLAAGGSGGMNIATDVTQMVVGALVFDTPLDTLLASPRFQVPTKGPTLAIPAATPLAFRNDLERRGERFATFDRAFSAVQLIRRSDGRLQAAADPRKFGRAVAE